MAGSSRSASTPAARRGAAADSAGAGVPARVPGPGTGAGGGLPAGAVAAAVGVVTTRVTETGAGTHPRQGEGLPPVAAAAPKQEKHLLSTELLLHKDASKSLL